MKIIINDEDNIVIFLNNIYAKGINFEDKYELETYFRELFLVLKKYYDICIYGYYEIDVYIDTYYGVVLDLKKDKLEYFEYFDSQVDMRISVMKNSSFLYKIYDCFSIDDSIKNKIMLYKHNNKIYLKIIDKFSDIDFGKLLENSDLVYGMQAENIILYNKLVKL